MVLFSLQEDGLSGMDSSNYLSSTYCKSLSPVGILGTQRQALGCYYLSLVMLLFSLCTSQGQLSFAETLSIPQTGPNVGNLTNFRVLNAQFKAEQRHLVHACWLVGENAASLWLGSLLPFSTMPDAIQKNQT